MSWLSCALCIWGANDRIIAVLLAWMVLGGMYAHGVALGCGKKSGCFLSDRNDKCYQYCSTFVYTNKSFYDETQSG